MSPVRQPPHSVEIQEPPLQSLKKRRSCLRSSCMFLVILLFITVIATAVAVITVNRPRVNELSNIPESIQEKLPFYDEKNIERITITTIGPRHTTLRLLALPWYAMREIVSTFSTKDTSLGLKETFSHVSKKLLEEQDSVEIQITWEELPATGKFIASYYEKELRKRGFIVNIVPPLTGNAEKMTILFEDAALGGTIQIMDTAEKKGAESIILTTQLRESR